MKATFLVTIELDETQTSPESMAEFVQNELDLVLGDVIDVSIVSSDENRQP